jgi:hypothetical protein
MGMFDSVYDSQGNEWQTKAFDCALDRYEIGDLVGESTMTYQFEVFGGPRSELAREAFATVESGRISAVPTERDTAVPLVDFHGYLKTTPKKEKP